MQPILTQKKIVLYSLMLSLAVFALTYLANHANHLYMLWNILLAIIPYLLSTKIAKDQKRYVFWTIFIMWLLFLPNCFYVMTDYVHLNTAINLSYKKRIPPPSEVIEILMFSVFTWTGFVLGFASIKNVFEKVKFKNPFRVLLGILSLSSIGIVLGRWLRLNSWDIFSPTSLIRHFRSLTDFNILHLILIAVIFAIFLTLILATILSVNKDKDSPEGFL